MQGSFTCTTEVFPRPLVSSPLLSSSFSSSFSYSFFSYFLSFLFLPSLPLIYSHYSPFRPSHSLPPSLSPPFLLSFSPLSLSLSLSHSSSLILLLPSSSKPRKHSLAPSLPLPRPLDPALEIIPRLGLHFPPTEASSSPQLIHPPKTRTVVVSLLCPKPPTVSSREAFYTWGHPPLDQSHNHIHRHISQHLFDQNLSREEARKLTILYTPCITLPPRST